MKTKCDATNVSGRVGGPRGPCADSEHVEISEVIPPDCMTQEEKDTIYALAACLAEAEERLGQGQERVILYGDEPADKPR